MAADNISLGKITVVGIAPAPRGVPQIEVTFDIDANGILNVGAKDLATGKEQKMTITASTKLGQEEIDRMLKEAQKHADEDKKRRETLVKRFQGEGIDLVHVHTPLWLASAAVVAAKRLDIPVVGIYHTMISEYTHYVCRRYPALLKGLAWRYASYFYSRCDMVTAPSRAVQRILLGNGVRNVRLLPRAVDAELFTPGQGSEDHDPVVPFVGRLDREKRVDVLMKRPPQILESCPGCKFRMVGTGILEKHYKGVVRTNGMADNFIFDSHLAAQDLINAYRSCDVLVLPSDTETLGLVALEAMACGKPVVGADARGLRDVISDSVDGYRFRPEGDIEFASHLLRLLEDEGLRRQMGARAREKAEMFSSTRITERWIAL